MPLDDYATSRFSPSACSRLSLWRRSFSQNPMWKMACRNLDRECDRNDIREPVWVEFLQQAVRHIVPEDRIALRAHRLWLNRGNRTGSADDDWAQAEQQLLQELLLDPLQIIDSVLQSDRELFVLPGHELAHHNCSRVYRYMVLTDFVQYHIKDFAINNEVRNSSAHANGMAALVAAIESGEIGGATMVGTVLGQIGYPVWCTNQSLLGNRDANGIRDALGLKHLDNGYLVEISYPPEGLRRCGGELRAPTVLDAWAKGAANWVFVKNRHISPGPDWGYTGHLSEQLVLAQGVPEAVHKPIAVDETVAASITVRVKREPITRSAPQIDYELTLGKADL